jgi:hypothetical protein
MRPKVVIIIFLAAVGILGVAAWISQASRKQPDPIPAPPTVTASIPAQTPDAAPVSSKTIQPAEASNTSRPAIQVSETNHAEWVMEESDRLDKLAAEADPEAHKKNVEELKNPDREIRLAALEALKQADDRSVVPQLQEIAAQTENPEDKQAIQETIDFINLPSLTEYTHQSHAK